MLHHFGQFGANHQQADAGGRQVGEDLVDLMLGPDINPPRWLVENQHARFREQPARKHNFLLISAG